MPKKVALVLLCCWHAAFAACGLSSSKASYDFFARNKHLGEVTQTIDVKDTRYKIVNKTEVGFFFLTDHIMEAVTGDVSAKGFQPRTYAMKESAKRIDQSWQFYPHKNLITGHINDHRIKLKNTHWPVYDSTSYQLALRCALQSGGFHQATYSVFSNGRIQSYRATLTGRDRMINTRLGKIKVDQVQVLITPGSHFALLWFAPKWDYLLVQSSLLLGKDGSFFTSINKYGARHHSGFLSL